MQKAWLVHIVANCGRAVSNTAAAAWLEKIQVE